MFIHMRIRKNTHYVYLNPYVYVHIYKHICIYTHMHTHTHTHTNIFQSSQNALLRSIIKIKRNACDVGLF